MSDERRFGEEEIAEILEEATVAREALPVGSAATGLTLLELQEIGSEAGIAPERIAEAAKKVVVRASAPPPERFLGATRSVSHTVHLDRALNDDEWTRLVAEVRRTFNAKGTLESHGSLKSWSNGNLQVHMEPDVEGYRIRMATRKGSVSELSLVGTILIAMGLVIIMAGFSKEEFFAMALGGMFSTFGLGQLLYLRGTLPGWARLRQRQMEELATKIPLLLDRPSSDDTEG